MPICSARLLWPPVMPSPIQASPRRRPASRIDGDIHRAASGRPDGISPSPPAEVGAATATLDPRQLGQALEGQQLDHVLLEKFVGGGGMGAVFRAWDTNLHRTVAVKVLSMRQAGDVESQRRFQIEARSAARLDHPNIARAHYVGEDRGLQYIVFEYIHGTNLRDLVYESGPMQVGDVLNVGLQIAGALHAFVGTRGCASRHQAVEHSHRARRAGEAGRHGPRAAGVSGAERARRDGDGRDARDVRLYLAGAGPQSARRRYSQRHLLARLHAVFHADRPGAVSGRHRAAEAARASERARRRMCASFGPMCPTMLASVIATMLAKQPDERFQTPLDLSAALTSCIEQLGLTPPAAALPAYMGTWSPPTQFWRRHAPWMIPAALLLVIVLVLGIIWHSETSTPEFPKLNVPTSLKSSETPAVPGRSAQGTPTG